MRGLGVDIPTEKLPAHRSLDDDLRRVTQESFQSITLALSGLYVLFVFFNLVDLPRHAVVPVVLHDLCVIVLSAALSWAWRSKRLNTDWIFPLSMGLALFVTSNVLTTMWLLQNPFYTTYIGIIVIGVGVFVLSTRWMVSIISIVIAAWAVLAAPMCVPVQFTHWGFMLAAALMVSITVHFARIRSNRRMAQLRYRDEQRKIELEQALGLAEYAREALDQKVESRTRDLVRTHQELKRELDERKRLEGERLELESRLQHTQKVESLGRMAGGVAHDFNNLLTIIGGATQLAMMHPDTPERVRVELKSVSEAAKAATKVTRQLLAFSRKQVLKPESISVRALLADMENMFHRLLGSDISSSIEVDGGTGCIYADAGLMEQVVMNLVINACDAMQKGGTLEIRAVRAEVDGAFVAAHPEASEGDYVCLEVRDSGHGMDAETLRFAFDPFFTTKDVDKGTGLGLAMVYGIVRQHGGFVLVESAPGEGSCFRVFLPRVEGIARRRAPSSPLQTAIPRGAETVLVAEDDDGLRMFAVNVLRSLGYAVLEAPDGEVALEVALQNRDVLKLVLTDVVMPRMNGFELASGLQDELGAVAILFTSGYADRELPADIVLEEGVNFLAKPYSVEHLALTVRSALDNQEHELSRERPSWIVVPKK